MTAWVCLYGQEEGVGEKGEGPRREAGGGCAEGVGGGADVR